MGHLAAWRPRRKARRLADRLPKFLLVRSLPKLIPGLDGPMTAPLRTLLLRRIIAPTPRAANLKFLQ
jgi:hypothetical protein